ncbi:hypothetical protein GCM10010524_35940 [Streptomyces mexicanus]
MPVAITAAPAAGGRCASQARKEEVAAMIPMLGSAGRAGPKPRTRAPSESPRRWLFPKAATGCRWGALDS